MGPTIICAFWLEIRGPDGTRHPFLWLLKPLRWVSSEIFKKHCPKNHRNIFIKVCDHGSRWDTASLPLIAKAALYFKTGMVNLPKGPIGTP